jgi:hypothetical protein
MVLRQFIRKLRDFRRAISDCPETFYGMAIVPRRARQSSDRKKKNMTRSLSRKVPKRSKPGRQTNAKTVRLLVYISASAKKNLEELRLRSLDKNGRKPDRSEIVDQLLTAALKKEKTPYPIS